MAFDLSVKPGNGVRSLPVFKPFDYTSLNHFIYFPICQFVEWVHNISLYIRFFCNHQYLIIVLCVCSAQFWDAASVFSPSDGLMFDLDVADCYFVLFVILIVFHFHIVLSAKRFVVGTWAPWLDYPTIYLCFVSYCILMHLILCGTSRLFSSICFLGFRAIRWLSSASFSAYL